VATLHPLAPKPKSADFIGRMVLEHYAPTMFNYGYHFKSLDKNIFTPVIRKQVRELNISNKGHYTVYLPSYNDERIIKNLKRFKDVEWQVFSKHNEKKITQRNIHIQPLNNELFLKSMASSAGVLCNAGFGTTSEALFLNKKLLVIPMKTQYEQHCNAAMLKDMGVTVVKKLKKKHADKIEAWLDDKRTVKVNYPDITEKIIDIIIENHAGKAIDPNFEHSHYYLFQ
ncbi:MAG: glycosyltransferase family protein, partial [Bacteroidota bacterium]